MTLRKMPFEEVKDVLSHARWAFMALRFYSIGTGIPLESFLLGL